MIDPRAVIEPGARLGADVSVGPFSIVENDVEIGAGSRIGPHVVIRRGTRLGRDNQVYQFASLGEAPQHLGYKDEATALRIGDRNIIREFCTLNRGTTMGGGVTRIGDDNFIMAYVHIAHDCRIGDRTIFANGASLAGHVDVGDFAILGGFTLVHQFCRVGAHCITGIGAVCLQDVPPYVIAAGNTAVPRGINVKGLRRRHFSSDSIAALKRAYRTIYRSNLELKTALKLLEDSWGEFAEVKELKRFYEGTTRGVIR